MYYNLVNDKKIIPLLLECILVFTNTKTLSQIPRLFNIFNYSLQFVNDIKSEYASYITCKCLEIWINTNNISYFNQSELFGCYLFLMENKYIELYSFQKWLNKNNYYTYNLSCGENITLTNFIMIRVEIFKLIKLAKTKLYLEQIKSSTNNSKYTNFNQSIYEFANLDNSNHNKIKNSLKNTQLITYNYFDKSNTHNNLLIEFVNSLSKSSSLSNNNLLMLEYKHSFFTNSTNSTNSSNLSNINLDDI